MLAGHTRHRRWRRRRRRRRWRERGAGCLIRCVHGEEHGETLEPGLGPDGTIGEDGIGELERRWRARQARAARAVLLLGLVGDVRGRPAAGEVRGGPGALNGARQRRPATQDLRTEDVDAGAAEHAVGQHLAPQDRGHLGVAAGLLRCGVQARVPPHDRVRIHAARLQRGLATRECPQGQHQRHWRHAGGPSRRGRPPLLRRRAAGRACPSPPSLMRGSALGRRGMDCAALCRRAWTVLAGLPNSARRCLASPRPRRRHADTCPHRSSPEREGEIDVPPSGDSKPCPSCLSSAGKGHTSSHRAL